jgi:hypothetical protein
MQEPRDWDEDYLLNLPVGEFDWLEVKGRRFLDLTLPNVQESAVRQNLSKAISAFANSGGGVVVLGLSNPTTSWHVDDGGIDLTVKPPSTREWLEDIIPTLVDLPLTSFNVYVVHHTAISSQIANGRGVFIIEIPDSEQAPHQATDNKYYARVAGKSRPISHRLVADIFGRRQYPKITLEFQIKSRLFIRREPSLFSDPIFKPGKVHEKKPKFELVVRARNIGRVFAKYVNTFVYVPAPLVPEIELELKYKKDSDFVKIDGVKYILWSHRNTERDFIRFEGMESQYGASWFDPILPGLSYSWERTLTTKFDTTKLDDLKILWAVSADNAPIQKGSTLIREIEVFRDE